MELDFSSRITFTPKFNGNRTAPESDRFTVTYKNPTPSMKGRLISKPELRFRYDAEGRVEGGDTVIPNDRKAIVDTMIIRIDGLSYTIDGEKKAITDAKTLWEAPVIFDGLITELADEFRIALENKVEEKN